ncbi:hypothetical protein IJ541_04385 [bacterium]|nr:hypothetical protein [bacterium]
MDLIDDIVNIQKKYFNNEDISIELSELLVRVKRGEYAKNLSLSRDYLDNYKDINKVAYFLAKFDHYEISKELRPTPAIREIAEKLNVKANTLRNKRDMFDSVVKKDKQKLLSKKEYEHLTIRTGRFKENEQVILPPKLAETNNECIDKSHDELLAEVKNILGLN